MSADSVQTLGNSIDKEYSNVVVSLKTKRSWNSDYVIRIFYFLLGHEFISRGL